MLEMLVVANSAFAIIKKTIENGRELHSAGSAIANFVGAEDKLRADVQRKKNSLWTKFLGKEDNDLEEFMALEEIRVKKEKLREFMQLYGRPNLYIDYIAFCTEARVNRKQMLKENAKAKATTSRHNYENYFSYTYYSFIKWCNNCAFLFLPRRKV